MTKQPVNLLIEAGEEIKRLRTANEILRAKVEMIDLFACVLHTRAAAHETGGIMGVDLVWKIEDYIRENP
jgi:hypothetical protein